MTARVQRIGFVAQTGQPVRDLKREHLISAALLLPDNAAGYHLSERLTALYPERALLECDDHAFDVEDYARAGHCTIAHRQPPHSQRLHSWQGLKEGVVEHTQNSWLEVVWHDCRLDVLLVHWNGDPHYYILADDSTVATRFLETVCAWNAQPHGAVLVFQNGHWEKDADLLQAIRGAGFDNLVLREGLKAQILDDATRFFASQTTYETYGVPWKRGLLFAGPPGNGKTHAVKALVNALGQTCLYVKSFRTERGPDEYSMRAVFAQARLSAPCVLVLEDLDALVTERNRSFFLNEMDGFATNAGILTVATSNHPERLDPAIVRRPSRFDRTYRFDLPAVAAREIYVARWNESLKPEMRVGAATIAHVAVQTEGFSFAYLKELLLSAMMEWMATPLPGAMDRVIIAQIDLLREQMLTAAPAQVDTPYGGNNESQDKED
jgi:hypothetical protein